MMKNIICLLCLSIITANCTNSKSDREFSSVEWKNGNIETRGEMVYHLIDSIGIKGKSKSEIIDLLGFPDDSISHRYYYLVDLHDMFIYDLTLFFDSSFYVKDYIIDD